MTEMQPKYESKEADIRHIYGERLAEREMSSRQADTL